MPLISFWKSAKDEVLKMSIEQIVSSAGDGNLLDNSLCCHEFRQYLSVAPIESLFDYARHCLENSFNKSGLVLQDIVNEFDDGSILKPKTAFIKGSAMPLDMTVFGVRRTSPISS